MAVTPAPDVAPSSSSWSWTRGLIGVPEAFISQCVASKTEQQILRAVVTQGLALEGLIDALVDLDRISPVQLQQQQRTAFLIAKMESIALLLVSYAQSLRNYADINNTVATEFSRVGAHTSAKERTFLSQIQTVLAGRIYLLLGNQYGLESTTTSPNSPVQLDVDDPFLTDMIKLTRLGGDGEYWNDLFSQSRQRLGLPDLRLDGVDDSQQTMDATATSKSVSSNNNYYSSSSDHLPIINSITDSGEIDVIGNSVSHHAVDDDPMLMEDEKEAAAVNGRDVLLDNNEPTSTTGFLMQLDSIYQKPPPIAPSLPAPPHHSGSISTSQLLQSTSSPQQHQPNIHTTIASSQQQQQISFESTSSSQLYSTDHLSEILEVNDLSFHQPLLLHQYASTAPLLSSTPVAILTSTQNNSTTTDNDEDGGGDGGGGRGLSTSFSLPISSSQQQQQDHHGCILVSAATELLEGVEEEREGVTANPNVQQGSTSTSSQQHQLQMKQKRRQPKNSTMDDSENTTTVTNTTSTRGGGSADADNEESSGSIAGSEKLSQQLRLQNHHHQSHSFSVSPRTAAVVEAAAIAAERTYSDPPSVIAYASPDDTSTRLGIQQVMLDDEEEEFISEESVNIEN